MQRFAGVRSTVVVGLLMMGMLERVGAIVRLPAEQVRTTRANSRGKAEPERRLGNQWPYTNAATCGGLSSNISAAGTGSRLVLIRKRSLPRLNASGGAL